MYANLSVVSILYNGTACMSLYPMHFCFIHEGINIYPLKVHFSF